jgi:uncharacterized SAM-binding protein YcdF (DUF218 family)
MAKVKPRKRPRKRNRLWAWLRAALFVALIAGLAVFIGFLWFANSVTNQSELARNTLPESLPKADGIIVWTGPGGGRLQAGADILKAERGERLLISGVNGTNKRDDILAILELPDELAECCVDLDYAAIDTAGNARESWAWIDALGYEHIILVTSAYHMPRAQIALGTEAGRLRVTPYPVSSGDYTGWWKNKDTRTRLTREYGKLLVSYFRDPATPPSRETPILELEVE